MLGVGLGKAAESGFAAAGKRLLPQALQGAKTPKTLAVGASAWDKYSLGSNIVNIDLSAKSINEDEYAMWDENPDLALYLSSLGYKPSETIMKNKKEIERELKNTIKKKELYVKRILKKASILAYADNQSVIPLNTDGNSLLLIKPVRHNFGTLGYVFYRHV